ncbi:MAG: hypothetical protein IJS35_03740 [Firmicutes bacterium]|nr:hypothetical protein [Bacillota bacterium]
MELFSNSGDSSAGRIDYNRLRKDLINEFGAQMAIFSGVVGFAAMSDAQKASEDQLLEMARRVGFNIDRYRI